MMHRQHWILRALQPDKMDRAFVYAAIVILVVTVVVGLFW